MLFKATIEIKSREKQKQTFLQNSTEAAISIRDKTKLFAYIIITQQIIIMIYKPIDRYAERAAYGGQLTFVNKISFSWWCPTGGRMAGIMFPQPGPPTHFVLFRLNTFLQQLSGTYSLISAERRKECFHSYCLHRSRIATSKSHGSQKKTKNFLFNFIQF